MVGAKRTKTKLCRRDATQEGSSSCRSSSSPSLGPSPVLLFLGEKPKKKRERKRHRAVSMDSSDFDLDDCCEMNVKRQNKESLINMTKRYMTAAGLGWEGVAGQLKGWLLRHFS